MRCAAAGRMPRFRTQGGAGELLSLTLHEDTRGEAVLVTRRRDVICTVVLALGADVLSWPGSRTFSTPSLVILPAI